MDQIINDITKSFIETLHVSHDEIHPSRLNFDNIHNMVSQYVNFSENNGYLSLGSDNKLTAALLYKIVETDLKKYLYLQYYFSKKEVRRCGLVSRLIDKALTYAKNNNIKEVSACVQDDNEASRRLITEKFAFAPLEKYYIRNLGSGMAGPGQDISYKKTEMIKHGAYLVNTITKHLLNFEGLNHRTDMETVIKDIISRYENSDGYYIIADEGDIKNFNFALCSVVRSFFKDYLSIDYYALSGHAQALLDKISNLANRLGLIEIGINVHVNDKTTLKLLESSCFINVDTNYVKLL